MHTISGTDIWMTLNCRSRHNRQLTSCIARPKTKWMTLSVSRRRQPMEHTSTGWGTTTQKLWASPRRPTPKAICRSRELSSNLLAYLEYRMCRWTHSSLRVTSIVRCPEDQPRHLPKFSDRLQGNSHKKTWRTGVFLRAYRTGETLTATRFHCICVSVQTVERCSTTQLMRDLQI